MDGPQFHPLSSFQPGGEIWFHFCLILYLKLFLELYSLKPICLFLVTVVGVSLIVETCLV